VSQQDFKRIFDCLGDALLIIERAPDNGLRVMEVNRTGERLMGRSRTECIDSPLDKLFSPALATRLAQACVECLAQQSPAEITAPILVMGNARVHSWRLSPIDTTGPGRIALLARDLGNAATQAATFRNVLDQTTDMIAHFDHAGRILYFNSALLKSMNFTESQIVGRTWPELLATPDAENYHEAITEVIRTGKSQEVELVFDLPAGRTWFQVRFTHGPTVDGAVTSVTTVGRDITAIKLVEEKLRQSEQHFRTLSENSPDCIMRFDREHRLIYANPTLERVTGVSIERFLGRTVRELQAGPPVPNTEGAAAPIQDAIAQVLHNGQPLQLEIRELNPLSGSGIVYSNFIFVPEHDVNGRVESVLAIGRDITPLKTIEADLRLLNTTLEERVLARTADLELANRDLKNFAYTVSHDLRAPLRAIIGFAAMLKQNEREQLSETGQNLLERVSAAALKLNRLIEDILQYSHAGQAALSHRSIALDQLAREVIVELHAQYPNASINVGNLPHVNGDPTMLRQIVQNLLGNALKFSARRTQPKVEFDWQLQDGQTVFFVRDNGAGFDMRYAHMLGSMFQRLHNEREFPGSGVGLAIVQRLVERYGGRLWASSELDAGATFYFTLPNAAPTLQTTNTH